ncbi:MAG: glycosyltransferase family 2 protein [Thermoanaerobaculales bacterium]
MIRESHQRAVAVGIVVVHYGDPVLTAGCLASIEADSSRVERRVVVVDNTGNLEPGLLGDGVLLVRRKDNPGFGSAANEGLAALDPNQACSAWLVLNNDAALRSGFLDAVVDALEDGVGAAGGPIRDAADPHTLWYAGGGLNPLTGTVWQRRSEGAARSRREVGFIPATALAVAPSAFVDVGGFDPAFFLYNEDVDLCLRLRRAGWRLRFEPEMVCDHRLGSATGSDARSPLYLENITRTRLLPFRPRAYRLYLAAVHTAHSALRILGLTVRHGAHSRPYVGAVIRGHWWALTNCFTSHSSPKPPS